MSLDDTIRNGRAMIRRNWRTVAAFVSVMVDIGIIAVGYVLAVMFWLHGRDVAWNLKVLYRLPVYTAVLFVMFCMAFGVYRMAAYMPLRQRFLQAAESYMLTVGILFCTLFWWRNMFYHRGFLVTYFTVMPVLYVICWVFVRKWTRELQRRGIGKWNTLVIGSGRGLSSLLERFFKYPELGFAPVGIIRCQMAASGGQKLHVDIATVEDEIVKKHIEYVVLSSPNLDETYKGLEELCHRHYVRMRVVSPHTDDLFARIGIYDIAGMPLYSPPRERIDAVKQFAKRVFDVVGALFLLLLFSPVFLLIAVATKLESSGPVFFTQDRSLSGHDKPFRFYKFRSMHHNADDQKAALLHRNESDGALFKMKDDPRLTKVGRLIRRYSIDELPQLLNVLKGDMSLVGPRPLPASDFRHVHGRNDLDSYLHIRASVKPGLTGLWQISGRSHLGFNEMIMLDLYYVDNQSLLFDLEILAQTIPVVVFGRGAY